MVGVRIDNVSKRFGKTSVIEGMDLTIAPGELFFLLGPSGCGKTTLLRMIAGFSEPSAGRIFFDDRDMSAVAPQDRNTGMVFQNYALWPHLSVADNVGFGLDVRGTPRAARTGLIREALALVHMVGYEQRYPHQLSGGQQQRVALARALVIKPDVVLLDEPLSNLDAGLRIEMRKEIHRIHRELGFTMVYVTHDQKEALSLATRLAVLNRGVLAQVATPAEIYQNPTSAFVAQFVGETNLLTGTVTRHDGAQLEISTPAGALICPRTRAVMDFAVGTEVAVSVRPEGLQFTPASPGPGAWRCTITETTYLGEIVQIVCTAGGVTLRMTVLNPAGLPPRAGDIRSVTINPDHVRILPREAT